MKTSVRFSGYRTVAMATDHTDAMGYIDIQTWPAAEDCLIGAWDIASKSTWRSNQIVASLAIKWVIGQAFVAPNLGRDIPYWRTIEVIALNYDGSRILHSVSDKSGVPFDFDTPDALFGPTPSALSYTVIRANNADDDDISVLFSGDFQSCHAYLLDQMAFVRSIGYDVTVIADDTVDCSHAELGSWRIYIDEMLSPSILAEISPFSPMQQIPYCEPGVSSEIRNALIRTLGYHVDVANAATIQWRVMDNGQYGWIADLPNGASYHWADGDFRRPTPRVELTEPQVKEMLLQLEHFSAVSIDSTDIDTCINASLFALEIMKILG